MFGQSEREKRTLAHLKNPQIGDRFHERFSFWVTVLFVGKNTVGEPVIIAIADNEDPYIYTPESFENRFLYVGFPGSWVTYRDTGLKNLEEYDVPKDVNFLWFCEHMNATLYVSEEEKEETKRIQYSDYVEHFVGQLARGKYNAKTMNALANALQEVFQQRGVSMEDIQKLSSIL